MYVGICALHVCIDGGAWVLTEVRREVRIRVREVFGLANISKIRSSEELWIFFWINFHFKKKKEFLNFPRI